MNFFFFLTFVHQELTRVSSSTRFDDEIYYNRICVAQSSREHLDRSASKFLDAALQNAQMLTVFLYSVKKTRTLKVQIE